MRVVVPARSGTRASVLPVRMIAPHRLRSAAESAAAPTASPASRRSARSTTIEQRDDAERGAKPREEILARLGALPDLDERAVAAGAPTRSRASPDPSLRGCSARSLRRRVDDAHEQPLGRGPLFGAHRRRQRAQPPRA